MLNSGTMGTVKSEPAYLPYLVFRSCVRLRLGPKSDGKASSVLGSMGGHGFDVQNLNIGFGWPDIIFKMGM